MSHTICFDFCRTVPDMLFFGLTAGRECYCLPFYVAMSGGSSKCDAVCEGEPTTMCGGMEKSSIFELHMCADTAEDLAEASEKAGEVMSSLGDSGEALEEVSKALQEAGEKGQADFGATG